VVIVCFFTTFFRSCLIPNDFLCAFRLIRWNSAPAPAAASAAAGDSSGSSSRSYSSRSSGGDSCYTDRDAHRFREERDATRHELEIISKQAGIAELEWQHQRKQLLEAIDGESCNLLNFNLIFNNTNCRCFVTPADHDAELNRLKELAEKLANKVNAPGDTPEVRLGAVAGCINEVALHGVRLGTALGLASMSTRTGVKYSMRPPVFDGGAPEDLDDIEATVERLDGHGTAIADSIHPQSVLNRLFD
jgi:hypothetical protein